MGGGDDKTTTQSASPGVNQLVNQMAGGLSHELGKGAPFFAASLYPGMSGTTTSGINSLTSTANAGAGGLNTAYGWMQDLLNRQGYNDALRGAESGVRNYMAESQAEAPGFQQVRQNLIDDVTASTNAAFNASGRFGGGSNVTAMSEGLTRGLGDLDYRNYTDRLDRMLGGSQALAGIGQTATSNAATAANAIPGLYESTLMPAATQIQAGQMLDADALAKRQAEYDYFQRMHGGGWENLAKASSVLGGLSGAGGSTTSEPSTPWWQSALGIGLGFL